MEYILCYTNENRDDVWERIWGEDAMQLRVNELMEELGCKARDIMCFDADSQL